MKKIMFNDNYGLTKAVLDGRKTMTRRIAEKILVEDENGELRWGGRFKEPRYEMDEIVAVAQCYKDVMEERGESGASPNVCKAGYRNKMFVLPELMPHRIRFTDYRIERMQDISDVDCLREGIMPVKVSAKSTTGECTTIVLYTFENGDAFKTPREAFSALVDKLYGKGTWESNPWVYVYKFRLAAGETHIHKEYVNGIGRSQSQS